jgi:tetratricopeptide (TPR) repeat protein
MENRGEPEDQILVAMVRAARYAGIFGQKEMQLQWAQRAVDRINNRPESVSLALNRLAEGYYYLDDFDQALQYYRQIMVQQDSTWSNLQRLGCIYAKMGQQEEAMNVVKVFQAWDLEDQYDRGENKYAQARVYAALGEREKALELMRQAFKEGVGFNNNSTFEMDYEFIPLQGYPSFEEFVKPKG